MLRDTLKNWFRAAIDATTDAGALPQIETPEFEVLHPKQAEHGDYTCNAAMVIAAAARKAGLASNPRQIAQTIVDHLPPADFAGSVELAGPGFINLRLADNWLQQQVAAVLAAGERFGDSDRGAGRRWQVEYVSANPTGPIHYGGARNAVLGESLVRVLLASGYDVQREFYVNDGGSQFQHFAQTVYARYMQLFGVDEAIPEQGYQGEYVVGYAQNLRDSEGDRFVGMDREAAVAAIKPLARAIVIDDIRAELAQIGVVFDNWFSEQSLYDGGLIDQSLAYLDSRGELERRDGAVWFKASAYAGNEKDEVVVRSNGQPTYLAGDIAYHYDKFIRRGFDEVVNVWAVDHQGHVARMMAVVESMGIDPSRLHILLYDMVKLVRDGVEVKLSKRLGNVLTIRDVVEEVGSDALHFNLLSRGPESVIEFDLELAVAQNNENPVYYVQYSHARICSILEKARAEGFDVDADPVRAPLNLLAHPSEFALIRRILDLEEQIDLAVARLSPHNLVHYAIDLAKSFSAFYRDCRVVDASEPQLTQARIQLTRAAQTALRKVLSLLGVSAPQAM